MVCDSALMNGKTAARNHQQGYILLTMMLSIALVTIAAAAVLPEISQQIRREREDELIHRGTAYMRAIQSYYKKMGRYPSRIEDLENTNIGRCLRKRYTDPLNMDRRTGKEADFELLYQQDIASRYNSLFGQGYGQSAGEEQTEEPPAESGDAENSGSDAETAPADPEASGGEAKAADGGTKPQVGPNPGALPNKPAGGNNSDKPSPPKFETDPDSPMFGGAIVGVVSKSKAKGVHEFYGKSHYNEWLFVFVPQMSTMTALKGPVDPNAPKNPTNGQNQSQPKAPEDSPSQQ